MALLRTNQIDNVMQIHQDNTAMTKDFFLC